MKKVRIRRGFTLVELLVVIAIIGILIGMLLPAVQMVREAARRTQCANNCRQMGLAVLNYESANMVFPPGWATGTINDPLDEPGWGWAVPALPFMEQGNVFDQIDQTVAIIVYSIIADFGSDGFRSLRCFDDHWTQKYTDV